MDVIMGNADIPSVFHTIDVNTIGWLIFFAIILFVTALFFTVNLLILNYETGHFTIEIHLSIFQFQAYFYLGYGIIVNSLINSILPFHL